MWVGCVVGSLFVTRVFLRVLHFLSSTKNELNSSLTGIDPHEDQLVYISNKTCLNMFDILAFFLAIIVQCTICILSIF